MTTLQKLVEGWAREAGMWRDPGQGHATTHMEHDSLTRFARIAMQHQREVDAQLAENQTRRSRTLYAMTNTQKRKSCEIAAAIRNQPPLE